MEEGTRKGFMVEHRLEHSVTDLDVVITPENVQEMGEKIAICALKHFLPYRKVEKYYFGLIRDSKRFKDVEQNISDGYDFAQAAILFLCEHMGHRLGDTVMGKYKKPVTIRHACYSVVGSMVHKRYLTQINTRGELRTDTVKVPEPFEEDTTEQSHKRVERIIRKMHLTKKQKQTLNCYLKGMGVCEIARLLCVNNTTVWRSRLILQRKYNEAFAD